MTEQVKDRIRFWAWLSMGLLVAGITVGQALVGVDNNTKCIERIDQDVRSLQIKQAKLEAIHRDVKKVQDQQDLILHELVKGRN